MRHILLFAGPLAGSSREVTDLQARAPELTFDGVAYRPGVPVGEVMYENAEWHCASAPESHRWRDALVRD